MDDQPASGAGASGAEAGGTRKRLGLALALAAALAAVTAAVLIAGGGEGGREFAVAPERCVEGWNTDPPAVDLGQHQFSGHGYYYVQVTTLTADGAAVASPDEPGAACALLFAAPTLSSEPSSAAMIQRGAGWRPLSGLQPPERLAALQSRAQSAYNAKLSDSGVVIPL